jgi:uncharacterized protein YneF (UPF0154 family)
MARKKVEKKIETKPPLNKAVKVHILAALMCSQQRNN